MKSRFQIAAALVLVASLGGGAAKAQLSLPRVSPKASVQQTIGLTEVSIIYSRPGVKGRTIWGDLVPYEKPWRTGANEATQFTTTDEIQFGGRKLPAGSYALLTIPGEKEWQVVLNRQKDLWGSNEYDAKQDVVRLAVKPTESAHQEWMSFAFENLGSQSADLVLRWEKLAVTVPIQVDVNAKALASARAAIAKLEKDDWRTPYQAAGFTLNNDVALPEGEKWLAQSLGIQENYYNLNLLARWRMKQGRKKEAIEAAEKAIAKAKASEDKEDTAPTEKLLGEWTASK